MPDLKNIRQIGSPTDTDKVYIENRAYQRIHREEFPERRVFVLMGHTECAPGGYTTFVEAVIPVWDIAFSHGVPVWNNHVWNAVFGEVKRSFENSVIIGWALDIKGMPPRLTAEVEAVHREHFGGAHQLLLLLDTLEQEECFYQNRSGYFYPKDGFYIYFDSENTVPATEPVQLEGAANGQETAGRAGVDGTAIRQGTEGRTRVDGTAFRQRTANGGSAEGATSGQGTVRRGGTYGKSTLSGGIRERRRIRENRENREKRQPDEDLVIIEYEETGSAPRARYRELMYGTGAKQPSDSGKWFSSAAVVAAVLLLFAIIGTGIRQGRFSLNGIEQAVESISMKVLPQADEPEADTETAGEVRAEDVSAILKAMEQSGTDTGIVVEEVPQGDIGGN
jgi:hypothetical protein